LLKLFLANEDEVVVDGDWQADTPTQVRMIRRYDYYWQARLVMSSGPWRVLPR